MSDYKPITGELRKYATVSWDPWPDARDRLYQMCDRIDAIHAGLERENAELRERMAKMDNVGESMHGCITHELREYAEDWDWLDTGAERAQDRIEAIADRIDAEHERECKEQYACGAEHGIGASIDASMIQTHGYVELPKDADGEYIHIGDRMEWVRYKDDDPTVVRTVSGIGNGVFFAWSDEQGRYAQYEAHAYRHHHAQTVEDVLREFALKVAGEECMTMRTGIVEEFAAKLRLVNDEE